MLHIATSEEGAGQFRACHEFPVGNLQQHQNTDIIHEKCSWYGLCRDIIMFIVKFDNINPYLTLSSQFMQTPYSNGHFLSPYHIILIANMNEIQNV